MGTFLEPENLKERTDSPLLKRLELDDLDDRFIIPAERAIEAAFSLDLDTDNNPAIWAERFALQPHLVQRFANDYRRATILLVNRMADNPNAYASRTVGGASVVYPTGMPEEVAVLMSGWSSDGDSGGRSGFVRRG
jgi:hypothetical protein